MNQNEHRCPRRGEGFAAVFNIPESDAWRDDGSCSYCGSLNPDAFMARVEAGDVQLTPTDKSYKVYIRNQGGEAFKMTWRKCPPGANCKGPDACDHWTTEDRDETKFYFQHLAEDQKKRFVELINEGKLKLATPGFFYVLPFFVRRG